MEVELPIAVRTSPRKFTDVHGRSHWTFDDLDPVPLGVRRVDLLVSATGKMVRWGPGVGRKTKCAYADKPGTPESHQRVGRFSVG
jgi:hypothetical protein